MTDWVTLINTVGLPIALLIVILAVLWKAMVWMANHVAKPMVDKHIQFLDAVIKGVDQITRTQQALMQSQAEIAAVLGRINEHLQTLR